jgi:hypothetical protein
VTAVTAVNIVNIVTIVIIMTVVPSKQSQIILNTHTHRQIQSTSNSINPTTRKALRNHHALPLAWVRPGPKMLHWWIEGLGENRPWVHIRDVMDVSACLAEMHLDNAILQMDFEGSASLAVNSVLLINIAQRTASASTTCSSIQQFYAKSTAANLFAIINHDLPFGTPVAHLLAKSGFCHIV